MEAQSCDILRGKHCVPCEGGVSKYEPAEARTQLEKLEGWTLDEQAESIEKSWTTKDFQAALDFINRIGIVAEAEGHHPDLHLTDYRNLRVQLSTHAIGGLSENDFILAAKVDAMPVTLKA